MTALVEVDLVYVERRERPGQINNLGDRPRVDRMP
jgi:hypothetical protein